MSCLRHEDEDVFRKKGLAGLASKLARWGANYGVTSKRWETLIEGGARHRAFPDMRPKDGRRDEGVK